MSKHFARLNIQIPAGQEIELHVTTWEEFLSDAAASGYAEDHEFFYIAQHRVIGISVPFEPDSPQSLLEAGSVLGYVHRSYEDCDIPAGTTWLSIHDSKDDTLSTVYEP